MDAHKRLARFAEQLRVLGIQKRRGTPRVIDDALPVVRAIRRYLDGEVDSLDKALGLAAPAHRPKGAPVLGRKHAKKALRIRAQRRAGKTWLALAPEFTDDVRTLQRIYAAWLPKLQAHEVLVRLRECDKK